MVFRKMQSYENSIICLVKRYVNDFSVDSVLCEFNSHNFACSKFRSDKAFVISIIYVISAVMAFAKCDFLFNFDYTESSKYLDLGRTTTTLPHADTGI